MIENIIYRYSEWRNRCEKRECEDLHKSISKRKWFVNYVPKLYLFMHISFAGIVVSFMFVLLAAWSEYRAGTGVKVNDWLAVPLLICGLVYFSMVLLLDRIYKNR